MDTGILKPQLVDGNTLQPLSNAQGHRWLINIEDRPEDHDAWQAGLPGSSIENMLDLLRTQIERKDRLASELDQLAPVR